MILIVYFHIFSSLVPLYLWFKGNFMNSFFFILKFIFFCHCRKMLIADINELKYQQEDAKKPSTEEDGEGKEDVTFLKLALKYVFSIPKL